MKYLAKIIKNQQGMSLLYTILIVSLSLGGLAYVTTEMIPKLHSEKKRAEETINYRVFISSLNDYLIHGIRERWCLTMNNGVSDLLLSNECGSGKSMEDIVTYPGNLERVLWGPENIGTKLTAAPAPENANRILALNYLRFHSTPKKASKLLKYEDIYPTDGKLNFRVTQNVLKDMTDQHPLYLISKNVRDCIDEVNISIFQIKDYNMINAGDERKIGISISTKISRTKFSCMVMRTAESTSYYTFYPRRLHTFSLMKYGNLNGTAKNEFHGPVYVAGDFVLPNESFEKLEGTVFYAPLVLGMYNSGGGTGSMFRAGRIVSSDNSDFTFEDRGHPYLSKQDNYPNFRGFMGGINLDATEDKGFYNLFDHTSSSSVDSGTLEACIEETKVQTTPSINANSRFGLTSFNTSPNSVSLKLGFNQKNRFKPSTKAPEFFEESGLGNSFFNSSVPTPPNGTQTLGELVIKNGNKKYRATIGVGSETKFAIDFEKFDITTSKINNQISAVEDAKRNNFASAIDSSHPLYQLPERSTFTSRGNDLKNKCDNKPSVECESFGYSNATCNDATCNYSNEINNFKNAKNALKNRLGEIKKIVEDKKSAEFVVTMSDVAPHQGRQVLNMRNVQINFTDEWKIFFPLIKDRLPTDEIEVVFTPLHFGPFTNRSIRMELGGPQGTNMLLLVNGGFPLFATEKKNPALGGWRNTDDNELMNPEPKPIIQLECPSGMGIADWDLDMSGSTNFAWNYANTPAGAQVDTPDHSPIPVIKFDNSMLEGHASSYTKSVVKECIVPKERTHVYGFYVCEKLTIESRNQPLYMVGTFIVKDLVQPTSRGTVYWHNVWDTKATDLVMTDLNAAKTACSNTGALMNYTWKDLKTSSQIMAKLNACSSMDMITNGPNNFSWTTVDPDIGIAKAGDVMTSQKVNRIQKWAIREDSRTDMIR